MIYNDYMGIYIYIYMLIDIGLGHLGWEILPARSCLDPWAHAAAGPWVPGPGAHAAAEAWRDGSIRASRKRQSRNKYRPRTPWLGDLVWKILPRPIWAGWAGPDPIFLAAPTPHHYSILIYTPSAAIPLMPTVTNPQHHDPPPSSQDVGMASPACALALLCPGYGSATNRAEKNAP